MSAPRRLRSVVFALGLASLAMGCSDKEKPIDRGVAARRSAAPERSTRPAEREPTMRADVPLVEIDATGGVRVDGADAGDTREIRELQRIQKVDELFRVLKERREEFKTAHPGGAFPGAVNLRVHPDTIGLVLKSVFQTAAFAGYPNITILIAGRPGLLDTEAQVPGPPTPEPTVPGKVLHVTATPSGVELTWRRGLDVESTRTVENGDVERAICDEQRANGAHTDAADPQRDRVVFHFDDQLRVSELEPYLAGIQRCTRPQLDAPDVRALTLTLSIR
jgi:hypothetical protein